MAFEVDKSWGLRLAGAKGLWIQEVPRLTVEVVLGALGA